MNKALTVCVLLFVTGLTAMGQTTEPFAELLQPQPTTQSPTNLPPLQSAGPVHGPLPSLISARPTEPEVITKANRRLWSADFEIEVRQTMSSVSNLSINACFDRKRQLEHLYSVDLVLGPTGETKQMPIQHCARLFVPLWCRDMLDEKQESDTKLCSHFVVSYELVKEAFLRLECFTSGGSRSWLTVGPKTVYLIDLNSFVPPPRLPPPPRKQQGNRGDKNDTIQVNVE